MEGKLWCEISPSDSVVGPRDCLGHFSLSLSEMTGSPAFKFEESIVTIEQHPKKPEK